MLIHAVLRRAATAGAIAAFAAGEAHAHAADRGFVLLLPTGHYLIGGALAVAASFVMLLFVPSAALARLFAWRPQLAMCRFDGRAAVSMAYFAVLAVLVSAGIAGSRDPLTNPLPLTVWTLFWVGLTLVSGLFGHVFAWLNPWYGPWRLMQRLAGHRAGWLGFAGLDRLGYLPAIVQFAAFAWFELVYPAPDDPARLAWAVGSYWLVNFLAALAFGFDRWMQRGECFSVFFGFVGKLGMLEAQPRAGGWLVRMRVPGGKLSDAPPLPMSGVLFLLFVLGTVSFDGFMRSFVWLGFIGVNPLEFPGRSAVMVPNTLGLAGMAAGLAAAFLAAVWLGERLAGGGSPARSAGHLVWSIAPIALAYHAAHYMASLLVNGQYALAAISDPFSRGWNLFGTADNYISAGLVMGPQAAWLLWNAQAAAIVGGHVLAVAVAHGLAGRLHANQRTVVVSQLPLAFLMVGYTVFGLWLLSTPTGA